MADNEGRLSPACLEDFEDETLDPRIQVELERLNGASEEINRVELELDDARASFRQALSETTHKLDTLAKKLGSCVDKARPYYDARFKLKEVHLETQKAAYQFERACSMHEAAKEMVMLAEQGYMQRQEASDPAWQEMLNHATMKVNEAERERLENEKEHLKMTLKFKTAEDDVQKLQKDLKRAIAKSKPYFEMKAKFNQSMEDRKRNVSRLETEVTEAKSSYSEALRNLEAISDGIHRQRLEMRNQAELGERGAGVGSESPSPPPMRGSDPLSIDGKTSKHTSSCSADNSQTTATGTTTSQAVDSQISSQNFRPPSVIFSSAEKARRQSYRDAIENRRDEQSLEESNGLEKLSEDSRVDMDEEFMSLPKVQHSGRLSSGEDSDGAITPVERRSLSPRGVTSHSPREITNLSPRENTQNISPSLTRDLSPGAPVSSGESTPLSGSPSMTKKSSKLQGLILKIGTGPNPLEEVTRRPPQRLIRQNTEPTAPRPASYSYSLNNSVPQKPDTSLSSDKSSIPTAQKQKTGSATPSGSGTLTPVTDQKRLLKVPSMQDFDEGSISDTESITSGTMLDDDQVELLTLEFSEQEISFSEEQEKNDRMRWHRMSLPVNLSHLEPFAKQISEEGTSPTEIFDDPLNVNKTKDCQVANENQESKHPTELCS